MQFVPIVAQSAGQIIRTFSDLNGEGVTLILVSHDLEALNYFVLTVKIT